MTIFLTIPALAVLSTPARAQVQFNDVSEDVGLTGFTESWGANFGDLNGDYCLDIYVNGHRDYPRVYRNTCTGEFEDIATEMDDGTWMAIPQDDKHGAAFGDFDNDGDEDIIQSVSVSGAGQLWVNQGDGTFVEQAGDYGVTSDFAARMAAWMDFSNDGLLDTLQMGLDPRSYTRVQTPMGEFTASINTDHDCDEGDINFIQLIDLNADGRQEMLCIQRGTFPFLAYDTGTLPFVDVTDSLPSLGNTNGAILGDANNDLRTDFILTRGATRPAGAAQVNNQRVEAWIEKDPGDPPRTGFQFQSGGNITVTNWSRDLSRNAPAHVMNLPFGASQQCSDNSEYRVCALYNAGQNRWEVFMGGEGGQTYIVVESTQNISNLNNVGQTNRDFPIEPRLYLNTPGGFNWDTGSGINVPLNCGGGVMADFDNDMDLDIYFSCGAGPENLPNRMYINDGNGNFTRQFNHGAEGPTGIGFDVGVAENTVFGDYNLDGFLDIFVTNGLLYYPWGLGGPDTLIENQGNSNHWVQLDLNGTTSNRSGVGARVLVTAGGVDQLREQNGGYNRWGQNQQWLHFGLASNMTADITIEWPSGAVDNHVGVAADALYEATEGGGLVPKSQGSEVRTILNPGDECGEPAYDFNFGPANLLWRDCGTDNWHFRSKGGRVNPPQLQTRGTIVGDAPFSGVVPVDLQGSDTLDNTPANEIYFDIRVNGINDQGFDFNVADQATSCLDFSRLDIETVIIGSVSKKVKTPIDLTTLFECGVAPPPNISISSASADEGAGTIDFTVSLSEISATNVTFQASTQDDTAKFETGDYTQLNNQSHVISAGNLSTTVSVTIGDDASAEIDEEFSVNLSNIAGARISGGAATGTILNNDGALPELSIADAEAFEDTGMMDIVISLNTPAVEDISFSISTSGQTASYFDDDYEFIIGEFVIPAGDTELTVPLMIGIDDEIEEDEFLFITLSEFSSNVNPVDILGVATILNDDGEALPDLSISDAAANEDTGTLSFTVSLSDTSTEDVTFDVSTSDGTATVADSDYTALANMPGVITAGDLSTLVTVNLGVDTTPEADEELTLTVANVSANANVVDGMATGTVLDDDTLPELSIGDAIANEDTGSISFTVSLNAAAALDVTFEASTADGTATTADSDYTALSNQGGIITTGNLSTLVTVALGVDSTIEPNEEFTVSLSNVSPNASLVDGIAAGTIANDDAPLPNLTIGDAAVNEDTGSISFTVSLSGVAAGNVTFDASTADGTATTANSDYTALVLQSGTITAGNTSTSVDVAVGVDSFVEPDEDFTVSLSNISPNVNVVDDAATGTINNDDSLPQLSIADTSAAEDTGSLVFTVSLDKVAAGDVTFGATTEDGTANTADNDYTALIDEPGTITAGTLETTVTVPVGVDTAIESDEDMVVTLANISANAELLDGVASGTIVNDDMPTGPTVAEIDSWLGQIGGVTTVGNQVIFDGTSANAWNNTTFSVPLADFGFTDEFELRFTIQGDPNNTIWAVGLGITEGGNSYRDIDYALRSSNGQLTIYESGDWQNSGPILADGDEISIFVNGGSIEYRVNGAPVFTSSYTGTPDWYVDTGFKQGAISVEVVAQGDAGPAEPPDNLPITGWVNQSGGVMASGSDLSFSGVPATWTNSINSVTMSSLGAGSNFSVSWTVDSNPAGTIWVVGLGVTETNTERTDIDYGFRSSNGTLQVRMNGTWMANAGALNVGDVLAIHVQGTLLEFTLNGISVFATNISGTEEFYIDSAFKTGAIALGSFTLTE